MHSHITRALTASAALAGCPIAFDSVNERAWNSATFAGQVFEGVAFAIPGDSLTHWLEALPETDFALRGHLVADIGGAVTTSATIATLRISAIILEDAR